MMRNRRAKLAMAVGMAVAGVMTVRVAVANVLYWDGNGATAPNPAGGAGSWDLSNSNWWNGTSNQTYATGVSPHDAIFGTTGGAVSLSSGLSAGSLRFDVTGYTLSGGSLTLSGPRQIDIPSSAVSTTISTPIAGTSGVVKTGDGKLTLTSGNSYVGLRVLGGVVSFSNNELQLGSVGTFGNPVTLTLDGGTLQKTGATSITTGIFRHFVVGPRGGTFDIADNTSGNNTGVTISATLSGNGLVTKTGRGTIRLGDDIHSFSGGLTILDGVFRFNDNNDAGPQALRMNRISFGETVTSAPDVPSELRIAGSGSNPDVENPLGGDASELRTGEWVSLTSGAGQINAATTNAAGVAGGARGHDLLVTALADGTFSGLVDNLLTAQPGDGGAAGSLAKHGNLEIRGIATQTLIGETRVNNTITVSSGAGLVLGGNAVVTGSDVNLNLRGGTFTLDNATTNNNNRYRDAGSIEPRGGGKLVFSGNAAGSTETMGKLQLGTNLAAPPKARSGQLAVDVIHRAGASAATVLTFDSIQRDSGRATIDFASHDGAGAMLALGQAGNAPRVSFISAPTLAAGSGLFESAMLPGDVGWATVNGSAFATYGANGVAPVSTVALASATSTDNAELSAGGLIAGGTNKTVATLAIAPSAPGQTLDLTGSANLVTGGILLSGPTDYTIRNASGGTGSITASSNLYVHVSQATLSVSNAITGSGALVKSGAGTLALSGANTYSGATTINAGVLRAGSANLGSGVVEFRGGVLELTGGGTFSRTVGVASGEINWNNTPDPDHVEDRGSGGFAARGANAIVDLNGAGASDLTWEVGGFVESGYALTFGSTSADARVDFIDNVKLNETPSKYNAREFRVTDNPGSAGDVARISGVISSDNAPAEDDLVVRGVFADLLKSGNGTLELTGNNTYAGGTIVAEGTLLVGHSNALGLASSAAGASVVSGPYVIVGNRGGSSDAALLTSAPATINREITIQDGSSGMVSLGGSSADASTFSGTIHINRDLTLTAAAGGTVSFPNGNLSNLANATLTKSGAGTVRVQNLRGGSLALQAGTLQVIPNSGSSGVTRISAISATSGKLDLTDNKMIITSTPLTDVQSLIASGRNNGAWDGPGIVTSQTEALSNYTSVAVATAAEAGYAGSTFGGMSVSASDVLVMYTYGGDANLSGNVDIDDYGLIDFNASTGGALTGWINGDFDYSGFQDIDDYGIIDFVVNIQGPPFSTAGGISISAVPEPVGLGLIAPLAAYSLRRRRRRVEDKLL